MNTRQSFEITSNERPPRWPPERVFYVDTSIPARRVTVSTSTNRLHIRWLRHDILFRVGDEIDALERTVCAALTSKATRPAVVAVNVSRAGHRVELAAAKNLVAVRMLLPTGAEYIGRRMRFSGRAAMNGITEAIADLRQRVESDDMNGESP
jgi:hypothetical protein